MTDLRRFTQVKELTPERVWSLAEDHTAVTEARTLFPTTVVPSLFQERLLVGGRNSRKIGGKITKGPWRGMRVYTLTLEERATCPKDCAQWRNCFGNGMQLARRHSPGFELENLLGLEVRDLIKKYGRIAVRLHILGDFYSRQYVGVWRHLMLKYEGLHIFGFTARKPSSEIGREIVYLNNAHPKRVAIRWSGTDGLLGSKVLDFVPTGPTVGDAFVCPAQTGKTACCGTCGLCWSPVMRGRAVALVLHGPTGRRKVWTTAKRIGLKTLWAEGASIDKICAELDFSRSAVKNKALRLGLKSRRLITGWTPERDAIVKKMWHTNCFQNDIGRALGGMDGTAISYRARRLGLGPRKNPKKQPEPVKPEGPRPGAPITLVASCATQRRFTWEGRVA